MESWYEKLGKAVAQEFKLTEGSIIEPSCGTYESKTKTEL